MSFFGSTVLLGSNRTATLFTETGPDGAEALKINLFAPSGALLNTLVVDRGTASGGVASETFADGQIVALPNGGFAIAVIDMTGGPIPRTGLVGLYSADGLLAGATNLDNPVLVNQPGQPALNALLNGGVFVVSPGFGGNEQLEFIGSTGAHTRNVSVPTGASLIDTGQGVVVTWMTPGGLQREVLDPGVGHNDSVAQPVAVLRAGPEGALLRGTGPYSDLIGGTGNDTLSAEAGTARLEGGAGDDRFVFGGGAPAIALDFGVSGHDTLAVTLAFAPVDPLAILAYDARTHLLSFDRDGGDGPSPPFTVAVLGASTTQIHRSDLAAGFQPGLVRNTNADGTHSDVRFDYGNEAFSQASADYNAAGQLVAYVVDFDDGHRSVSSFDALGREPWTRVGADYDAQGRITFYGVLNDDGSHTNTTFDPANTQSFQRIGEEYDAAGRLTVRGTVLDDNSLWVARFDVANTHPYGYSVEIYDPTGRLTGVSLFNDDGSPFH